MTTRTCAATFTCARCRRTFGRSADTDAVAIAEMERDYPGLEFTEADLVCEDCYKAIINIAGETIH